MAPEVVRKRRRSVWHWLAGDPTITPVPPPPVRPTPRPGRIGICCSGGGIRSAAYSLGALSVLRDAGMFRCVDPEKRPVVSAVSGGSYIASSFATVASGLSETGGTDVYGANSPEERHLRNHSSYMAPGLAGKVRLVARVLFGMLPNFLLIAVAVFVVGWLLGALWVWWVPELTGSGDPDTTNGLLWAARFAVAGVIVASIDLVFQVRDSVSTRLQTWSIRLLVASLIVLLVFVALPELIASLRKPAADEVNDANAALPVPGGDSTIDLLKQLSGLGIVGTVLSAAWAFIARRGKAIALAVAAVTAPLALILPLVVAAEWIASGGISWSDVQWLGGAIALAACFWFFVDLNQWSLNPFYRRRLSSAFFVRRDGDRVIEQPVHEPLKFSQLETEDLFPDLIVCAAANLSDDGVTPPGRNATPFRFSKEAIGGPLVSAPSAAEYEQAAKDAGRDASISAAVAVSGAAVSPTMGKKTLRAFTMLLTLTNVRLGVWLPNPAHLADKSSKPTLRARVLSKVPLTGRERVRSVVGPSLEWLGARRPGPHYLFKEMFGLTSITDPYLYVTDGGHYDNLGLVELLREGCTTVFCLDGGGDASGTYQALGEAVALARSELGVDVEVDPLPIAAENKKEFAPTDHVLGEIRYRGTIGEAPMGRAVEGTGTLVYCRAAVTEDAPWDVRDFRSRDRRFPIHSTLDQLFNDQKFESYRALGGWTARRALKTWQRRVLVDAVRRALIERARTRDGWFCHQDLVADVLAWLRAEFGLATDPSWAPANEFPAVLTEISSMEEAAQRPPLTLIVQERRPEGAILEELTPVWDYWASSEAVR